MAVSGPKNYEVEHSNSRFDSIRCANRFESIRFLKKSAFRFSSCHVVFLAYLLYSLSQKNKLTSLFAECNTSELHVVNLLEIIDTDWNQSVKRRRHNTRN